MKKINVLSLFDGISCGQIALERLGIDINEYYASEIDKHAIKVTGENYPNTIQLGDVTQVNGVDLPKIDLMYGGSPCFTEGNLVMTKSGYKDIKDIIVGDYVLTHLGRYKKVLRIGNDFKKTYNIKAYGSTDIITTENHPFYCYNNRKYSWKKISEFNIDDKVVSLNWSINEDNLTDNDLYILGKYLANGTVYNTYNKKDILYNFKITLDKDELEFFKNNTKGFSYDNNDAYIEDKKWFKLGKDIGRLSHNKSIPNFILDLPQDRLEIFLESYLNENVVISGEELALTLSLALQKCGKQVIINRYENNDKLVLERDIVFNHPYRYDVRYTINEDISDYINYDIINTNDNNVKEIVYNIEVEDDNSYIVNNLIVHNCQGFSVAGKQLNFDDHRSKLFFEFVRVLKEIKPKYFLLENVKMKKEYMDIITDYLGVEPIEINSGLVSAQNRRRLYWTNIPGVGQPIDKEIYIKDILEKNINDGVKIIFDKNRRSKFKATNKKYVILYEKDKPPYSIYETRTEEGRRERKRLRELTGIDTTPRGAIHKEYRFNKKRKTNCLVTVQSELNKVLDENYNYRFYTNKEYCRMQNVPDDYFDETISDNQIRKMLGNGWTVDVIAHIFSYMNLVELPPSS